jgi:glycosyltransferase involved in cell wall biosynthesis
VTLTQTIRLFLNGRLDIPGQPGMARILVIHPSGHNSSSGPYLQALASALAARGHAMLMLGEQADYQIDEGVTWLPFRQWKGRLTGNTWRRVCSFQPDIILLVGIRCRAMLAALEISWRLDLPMLLQLEDDDQISFMQHYPKPDPALLELLDTPSPDAKAVAEFAARIDWPLTTKLWKSRYRLVEPVLRALVLHQAHAFGAIWHPMAERLRNRFAKPVVIVPPVVNLPIPLPGTREDRLAELGVPSEALVIFVSGTIYNHSTEFSVFLEALNQLHKEHRFTLVLTSRAHAPVRKCLRQHLSPDVAWRVLDLSKPEKYEQMLCAADIIAVPGLPDEFNRLRLPARIPRALIHSKPVFTFACGFGESLQDDINCVLTQAGEASEWARQLAHLFDEKTRSRIGLAGREFASMNFLADETAEKLSELIRGMKKHLTATPPATMAPLRERVKQHLFTRE